MKHCGREADRKERAYEGARRALIDDCKKELSPAFLEKIRAGLSDPQKKLFAEGLAETCASGTVARGGHVLEQAVLAHLRRREASGQNGKSAVLDALADALSNRKASQFRAMEGHWMKEAGISAVPAVQAAKQALQTLPSIELASQLLDGQFESIDSTRGRMKIDLDENLRLEGGGH